MVILESINGWTFPKNMTGRRNLAFSFVFLRVHKLICFQIDLSQVKELLSRTRDNAVQLDVSAEADALDRQLAETTALFQKLQV